VGPHMHTFVYPVRLTADRNVGGFVVSCRDIPEAITQGESRNECIEQAAGALQAALEGRMISGLDIPKASEAKRGEQQVAIPVQTALKAALYLEMRKRGMTRVELARRLRIDEKEARRMLDPYHATKAARLEQALAALGRQAELRVA
jgi:antitoxin HicB